MQRGREVLQLGFALGFGGAAVGLVVGFALGAAVSDVPTVDDVEAPARPMSDYCAEVVNAAWAWVEVRDCGAAARVHGWCRAAGVEVSDAAR